MEERKYISDVITEKDVASWKNGERILIHAQTGSGKSHFVKNVLYRYCRDNNKKVLLLSNRAILKAQNEVDLEGKLDVIHIENYQKLESEVLNGRTIKELFMDYDIIVYDETHYLFSDSQFNRNTDLLIDPIINNPKDKIFVFCTATPEALLYYNPTFERNYSIPFNYDYIEDIYFYSKNATIEEILNNIPQNEKVIYFSSDAFDAYEIASHHEDAEFICSESNKNFAKRSSKKTIHEIVNYNTFYSRILCTTKVLDNGINIIDKNVKHIIIDMLDPISLVQCLGRKRIIDNDDKITVYIKNYHGGWLYSQIESLNAKLKFVEEIERIGVDNFQAKYKKKDFDDIIQNDFTINQSKLVHYKTNRKFYSTMLNDRDKVGYKKMVYDVLYQKSDDFKSAENKFEKNNLEDVLDGLVGIQLFDEEIKKFKNIFFSNIFSSKNVNYRNRGILCINAILEEDDLDYRIISNKERKKPHRNKVYWTVNKL